MPVAAQLDIFDITGYRVKRLASAGQSTSQRTFLWDGTSDRGEQVGSGVYLILYRDQQPGGLTLRCDQKIIVVR